LRELDSPFARGPKGRQREQCIAHRIPLHVGSFRERFGETAKHFVVLRDKKNQLRDIVDVSCVADHAIECEISRERRSPPIEPSTGVLEAFVAVEALENLGGFVIEPTRSVFCHRRH